MWYNPGMPRKKESDGLPEDVTPEPKTELYSFPSLGISVNATSREEAEKMVRELVASSTPTE